MQKGLQQKNATVGNRNDSPQQIRTHCHNTINMPSPSPQMEVLTYNASSMPSTGSSMEKPYEAQQTNIKYEHCQRQMNKEIPTGPMLEYKKTNQTQKHGNQVAEQMYKRTLQNTDRSDNLSYHIKHQTAQTY